MSNNEEVNGKLIPLSSLYYIGADKYNWILYTKNKTKQGKEYFKADKFYPTLEALLTKVLDMNLRGLCEGKATLKELVKGLTAERKEFEKYVKKACEGIRKESLYETKRT